MNEALLLAKMKNQLKMKTKNLTTGLGTAATRASIIDSLYIKKLIFKNNRIYPSDKAIRFISLLTPELKDTKTTLKWEESLKEIENNQATSDQFLTEIINL